MAEICGTVVHFKVYNDAVKIVVVLFTNNIFIPKNWNRFFCGNFFGTDQNIIPNQPFQSNKRETHRHEQPTPPHPTNQQPRDVLKKTLRPVQTGCVVICGTAFSIT